MGGGAGRRQNVDASLGGIGGCPFAPRATGNVPTEDVAYMLHRSGYHTGLDLDRLIASARWLGNAMGRDVPGMLSKAAAPFRQNCFIKVNNDPNPADGLTLEIRDSLAFLTLARPEGRRTP